MIKNAEDNIVRIEERRDKKNWYLFFFISYKIVIYLIFFN
jgi:hypothetical protein